MPLGLPEEWFESYLLPGITQATTWAKAREGASCALPVNKGGYQVRKIRGVIANSEGQGLEGVTVGLKNPDSCMRSKNMAKLPGVLVP